MFSCVETQEKSQFLKYVQKIAHRAVFSTGQGASAVGLIPMCREVSSQMSEPRKLLCWLTRGSASFDKMNIHRRRSLGNIPNPSTGLPVHGKNKEAGDV